MAMPAPSCSSSSSVRSRRKRWRPKSRMRWAAATTRPVPSRAGYQNGYRRGRLRTAEGPIEYGVPQVADRPEPFVSRVRAGLAGRTAELEQLALEMYTRGLSTRDIEAAFRDASGRSVLSRTAVSQVTERRTPADEDHPARLRRAAGPEDDVRRRHPGRGSLAGDPGRRVRAASAEGDPRRAQPRPRRADQARRAARHECIACQIIEQEPNLTRSARRGYAAFNMKRVSIAIALVGGMWFIAAVPMAEAAPCLMVTLTGTQGGPSVFNGQAGAGTLVRYGDDSNNCGAVKLQFDAGRGTNMRLSQIDVTPVQLNAIFFTHMHSDHTEGFADIMLLRWYFKGPQIDMVCSADAVSALGFTNSCRKYGMHIGDPFLQSGEIAERRSEDNARLAGGPADLTNMITFEPKNEP